MKITITITETPIGDIAIHIKEAESMATLREGKYAEAITKSLKRHLAEDVPAIAKQIKKQEEN